MTKLENAFKDEGYHFIPFSLNGVGHPTIALQLKNKRITFLLDTGAASNLLDVEFAKSIGLPLTATGQKGGGAGGVIHEIYSIGKLELSYDIHLLNFDQFFAINFNSIKLALKAKGVIGEFQGILGYGFFKMTQSFIDYADNRVFIKPQSQLS